MSQRLRQSSQPPRTTITRQVQLDSYFPGTRGQGREASNMAPTGKTQKALKTPQPTCQQKAPPMSASPASSPGSVTDSAPPTSPASPGGRVMAPDLMGDEEIRRHVMSLPTREDLERFTSRVERAFTEDIAQLKADTSHLGSRVEALEEKLEEALPTIALLQAKCNVQDQRIETLLCQLDDSENRSRRVNIRIKGLPEATAPRDIIPTLQDIFRDILGLPATAPMEIDRSHRALRPPSQDADNPRDVICKLHKYTFKERIMQKMRNKPFYDFDGARLSFYQDISRRTLMQRRALRPILTVLQDAGLTYRWGFPFYLQATKDGKQATLRTKDDLPHFLSTLGLDPVDFPDWREPSEVSSLRLPEPWTTATRKSRKRDRQRSNPLPGPSASQD